MEGVVGRNRLAMATVKKQLVVRKSRRFTISLSHSFSFIPHLLPSFLPFPFTPPSCRLLFPCSPCLHLPLPLSVFLSPLCLLVFSVLRPSRRGFLWWPNYEIQQANWGCLKQGLLGRLAAAGEKLLGHGEAALVFTHPHTNTDARTSHSEAQPSITTSPCISNLTDVRFSPFVLVVDICDGNKGDIFSWWHALTCTHILWRVNGLYFCKLNKSNPLVTPLVMAYLIWI